MNRDDVHLKKIAKLMFNEFEKYWFEFYFILIIAVILDSHYKLQFIG